MNTTGLIAQWSMAGAESDLSGRFGSVHDLYVPVETAGLAPRAAPVLMKRADEQDWRPLLVDLGDAATA